MNFPPCIESKVQVGFSRFDGQVSTPKRDPQLVRRSSQARSLL